uniref:ATP synthase F0 subunit 8 n=1 Tax=Regioscalpellum regium TaxID=2977353 RepID=UPI0021CC97B3|nr:ATP synthase F0 subunit 8 [Regioscalpellum regium]UWM12999.1 ATP synthase F0 subunit 8 [Regioscalpellum regium]
MPHMSPILWTFIFFASFISLIVFSSLIYFTINPFTPIKVSGGNNLFMKIWVW